MPLIIRKSPRTEHERVLLPYSKRRGSVAFMRSDTRKKTGKSPLYLKFIRAQDCIVCAKLFEGLECDGWTMEGNFGGVTEAAHVGPRGRSTAGTSGATKPPDRRTLPFCGAHHQTSKHSFHKLSIEFWTLYGLDPEELIRQFNARFDSGERAE